MITLPWVFVIDLYFQSIFKAFSELVQQRTIVGYSLSARRASSGHTQDSLSCSKTADMQFEKLLLLILEQGGSDC